MEPDRSILIPRPHLHDNPNAPPDLPTALIDAHSTLSTTANETAAKAAQIASDPRWSESERSRLPSELCTSAMPGVASAREVAYAVERLADEATATKGLILETKN